MNIDPLAFIGEFQAEADDHLRALDEQLMRLERDPSDIGAVRAMFLSAHSIKGGAAMLGLEELRDLAHALEDVLGVLREAHKALSPTIADVLFRAIDQLRAVLARADGTPRPSAPETIQVVAALAACSTPPPAVDVDVPVAPRVLLVEDSPSVRQVETFLLEDAGFTVDAVDGADEALERAGAMRYVLVIAGMETREMRGPDLAIALHERASSRTVPILLTSTDFGAESATSIDGAVFTAKGRLGDLEFARIAHQLTEQEAA